MWAALSSAWEDFFSRDRVIRIGPRFLPYLPAVQHRE
jgi:hypothetical protein